MKGGAAAEGTECEPLISRSPVAPRSAFLFDEIQNLPPPLFGNKRESMEPRINLVLTVLSALNEAAYGKLEL